MVVLLVYETSLILYRLYNAVTVSVHSNNTGTCVDIAVGCMQGSIIYHHNLLRGSCFIEVIIIFGIQIYNNTQ